MVCMIWTNHQRLLSPATDTCGSRYLIWRQVVTGYDHILSCINSLWNIGVGIPGHCIYRGVFFSLELVDRAGRTADASFLWEGGHHMNLAACF
jgi:hypothetical protein